MAYASCVLSSSAPSQGLARDALLTWQRYICYDTGSSSVTSHPFRGKAVSDSEAIQSRPDAICLILVLCALDMPKNGVLTPSVPAVLRLPCNVTETID